MDSLRGGERHGLVSIASTLRPTAVTVDLAAIRHNIGLFRDTVGEGVEVMAVVKANAYGHGAAVVGRQALEAGARWLGVATAEEGSALRQAGIEAPILILGQSTPDQIVLALEQGLDITVFDLGTLDTVVGCATKTGRKAGVHVKIDSGMGRVGMAPEAFDERWLKALDHPGIHWHGLMSHLAESDAPDDTFTRVQLARFLDVIEFIRIRRPLPPYLHLANSAAVLRYPGTHFNLVRVGLGLYGAKPFADAQGLWPALSWTSQVVYVKAVPAGFWVGYGRTYRTEAPAKLAAVPVGYADGYRRGLSNLAEVIIRGRRYPVVGRISMDQITVAVPPQDPVAVGDTVTLMGVDGDQSVSVDELAEKLGTISYEVLTGISERVPRRYVDTEILRGI